MKTAKEVPKRFQTVFTTESFQSKFNFAQLHCFSDRRIDFRQILVSYILAVHFQKNIADLHPGFVGPTTFDNCLDRQRFSFLSAAFQRETETSFAIFSVKLNADFQFFVRFLEKSYKRVKVMCLKLFNGDLRRFTNGLYCLTSGLQIKPRQSYFLPERLFSGISIYYPKNDRLSPKEQAASKL